MRPLLVSSKTIAIPPPSTKEAVPRAPSGEAMARRVVPIQAANSPSPRPMPRRFCSHVQNQKCPYDFEAAFEGGRLGPVSWKLQQAR